MVFAQEVFSLPSRHHLRPLPLPLSPPPHLNLLLHLSCRGRPSSPNAAVVVGAVVVADGAVVVADGAVVVDDGAVVVDDGAVVVAGGLVDGVVVVVVGLLSC